MAVVESQPRIARGPEGKKRVVPVTDTEDLFGEKGGHWKTIGSHAANRETDKAVIVRGSATIWG
jgi:hypothetical protein